MPLPACPCYLPVSLRLGLSLQTLARGQGGQHGTPSSEETLLQLIRAVGPWRELQVLPGLSGGPLVASPFPVTIGQWQPLGQTSRTQKHPPGARD